MNHSRKIIYFAGFLYSFPVALASYINSSFISSFTGEKLVGIIYVLGSIGSVTALLLVPKVLRKMGGYKFLLFISFLFALVFSLLAFVSNTPLIIVAAILAFALNTMMIFSLDELLKIFSEDRTTGRIRGRYIMLSNLAWIFAQVALGTFLGGFGFRAIYFVSSIVMLVFMMVSFFSLKRIPDPNYDEKKIWKYVNDFFKNKNLSRAFGLTFLLQLFYCWMVIYTPIYLSAHLHFTWEEIGVIFAIMLLPFLFVPTGLGKYADKFGERKLLMSGFGIMALSTLSLFFIKEHVLLIWASLLFVTRIGASAVESMSDSYFFKHIKSENEEYVGVYRSASPIAYVVGPIIAFAILFWAPGFNFIYLVLGAMMLLGIYLASTIKRSDI